MSRKYSPMPQQDPNINRELFEISHSLNDLIDEVGSGGGGGSGTVTSVSVTTANGVSGSVATATTTPAITLTLGDITPNSVAAVGTVSGSNLSGTNTGDQNVFSTVAVAGQTSVVADSTTDTLTLAIGSSDIEITTNATTDTVTIKTNFTHKFLFGGM